MRDQSIGQIGIISLSVLLHHPYERYIYMAVP